MHVGGYYFNFQCMTAMPNEVSAQIQELTTQFIRKTTVATKYVRLFAHNCAIVIRSFHSLDKDYEHVIQTIACN